MNEFNNLFNSQKEFFNRGAVRSVKDRIEALRKLREVVLNNEQNIYSALNADLGKPVAESFLSEFSGLIKELNLAINFIERWAKRKRIPTPLMLFPASSYEQAQPFGQVLIISPWNYPLDLALSPLVSAVAAGNTAIIKPSEYAPATANIISKIVKEAFDEEHVSVVLGEADVSQALLKLPFNYIFFTGSERIGKLVYQAAAKLLIPVTLELGGKCPAIILSDYSVDKAAKSIAWGKFFNAGQTCIAPDYVLIPKNKVDDFVIAFKRVINDFFSDGKAEYSKLVSKNEYARIASYLNQGEILAGGQCWKESQQIEPSIIRPSSMDEPIMKEEIFGPVLALIPYTDEAEIEYIVSANKQPLSLYVFSNNRKKTKQLTDSIASGGVCINDVLLGFVNRNLPFGGVGLSGIGKYHGKAGFDTFSNNRGVIYKKQPDLPLRYPPYGKVHRFLRKVMSLLIKDI